MAVNILGATFDSISSCVSCGRNMSLCKKRARGLGDSGTRGRGCRDTSSRTWDLGTPRCGTRGRDIGDAGVRHRGRKQNVPMHQKINLKRKSICTVFAQEFTDA